MPACQPSPSSPWPCCRRWGWAAAWPRRWWGPSSGRRAGVPAFLSQRRSPYHPTNGCRIYYTWMLWQGEICRQFSILTLHTFIDQFIKKFSKYDPNLKHIIKRKQIVLNHLSIYFYYDWSLLYTFLCNIFRMPKKPSKTQSNKSFTKTSNLQISKNRTEIQ